MVAARLAACILERCRWIDSIEELSALETTATAATNSSNERTTSRRTAPSRLRPVLARDGVGCNGVVKRRLGWFGRFDRLRWRGGRDRIGRFVLHPVLIIPKIKLPELSANGASHAREMNDHFTKVVGVARAERDVHRV